MRNQKMTVSRNGTDVGTATEATPMSLGSAEPGARPVSRDAVSGTLRLIDFCAICASGAIAYWIWLTDELALDWTTYGVIALFGALLAVNVIHIGHGYSWETLCSITSSLRRTALGWAAVIGVLVLLAFLTKTSEHFSRAWLLLWCALSTATLCVSRVIVYFSILDWKSQGRLRRNIAVVGLGPIGQRLISWLIDHPDQEYRVVGAFDDRLARSPHYCWEVPLLGNVDALLEYLRRHPVDMVVVALPLSAEERLCQIFHKLKAAPVDVRLCPDAIGFRLGQVTTTEIGDVSLLNVANRPLAGWRGSVKNIEDRILASLILLMIAPLMAFIALAIKLDSPGPVLFRQKRYGFNNQLIDVFKFRTMYHDRRDEEAEQLTRRNDPRVTRVGAFLRKTSLDELPQFFNVLRGEMSIVGPRPHACKAKAGGVLYQQAVEQYESRHRVKPGITGWAQINGWRGETETVEQIRKRVEHDLAYIENWSVGFDLKIILRTALTGFSDHRAY